MIELGIIVALVGLAAILVAIYLTKKGKTELQK